MNCRETLMVTLVIILLCPIRGASGNVFTWFDDAQHLPVNMYNGAKRIYDWVKSPSNGVCNCSSSTSLAAPVGCNATIADIYAQVKTNGDLAASCLSEHRQTRTLLVDTLTKYHEAVSAKLNLSHEAIIRDVSKLGTEVSKLQTEEEERKRMQEKIDSLTDTVANLTARLNVRNNDLTIVSAAAIFVPIVHWSVYVYIGHKYDPKNGYCLVSPTKHVPIILFLGMNALIAQLSGNDWILSVSRGIVMYMVIYVICELVYQYIVHVVMWSGPRDTAAQIFHQIKAWFCRVSDPVVDSDDNDKKNKTFHPFEASKDVPSSPHKASLGPSALLPPDGAYGEGESAETGPGSSSEKLLSPIQIQAEARRLQKQRDLSLQAMRPSVPLIPSFSRSAHR